MGKANQHVTQNIKIQNKQAEASAPKKIFRLIANESRNGTFYYPLFKAIFYDDAFFRVVSILDLE